MEMLIKNTIHIAPSFTAEEMRTLEEARKREIVCDKDCPETTPERAVKFKRVNAPTVAVGK